MKKEFIIAFLLQVLSALVSAQQEYRGECVVWQNVTETSMYKYEEVPTNCQKNAQCTGFDCSGEFTYVGPLSLGQPFTVNFCFGIAIHPCDKPLSMSFYVEKPHEDAAFQKKITGSGSFQLPAFHYTVAGLISADGFVDVDMVPQEHNGYKYLEIGVNYKTRVSMPIKGASFPNDLKFRMMPDTLVPVPPCEQNVKTDLHVPGNCAVYVAPTRPPGFTTINPPTKGTNCTVGKAYACHNHEYCKTATNKTKEGSCVCTPGYYRVNNVCTLHPDFKPMPLEACVPNEFGACGMHQVCQQKTKRCECLPDYHWDGSKCAEYHPPSQVDPIIIGEPDFSKDSNGAGGSGGSGGSGGNFKIIIPVVAGVAVAICVIAGVVFVKYRRYKARYGQHSLLMAEDDDDRNDDGDDQLMEA